MMVNDVDPIFENLPRIARVPEELTVIDSITKRHYLCSSSSMLNYDDCADAREHDRAHEGARVLFNMVLAQRFILSAVRMDIVRAEQRYAQDRDVKFGRWLTNWFKNLGSNKNSDVADISELRERIQHLTTSAWFNVISLNEALQSVFEKLRARMKVPVFYQEVKDRADDLDEFIQKKQADAQQRVFDIFTFIMSPLNLVAGFSAGYQFSEFKTPFPGSAAISGWRVFLIYLLIFSGLTGMVWIMYRWRRLKGR